MFGKWFGTRGWVAVTIGIGAMMLTAHGASANEAVVRPSEALRVLVQAREVNARCGFLPAARDELSAYAARAEIATAAREGVSAANAAVDAGRHAAAAVTCDAEAETFVGDALAAAREAMRQARTADAPRRRAATTVAAKPSRPTRAAAAGTVRPTARIARQAAGNTRRGGGPSANRRARDTDALARRYVKLAGTYYLDLRCRRLPYPRAKALWRRVKTLHYRLLREGGARVLLAAKRRAQARAARRSCGSLRMASR